MRALRALTAWAILAVPSVAAGQAADLSSRVDEATLREVRPALEAAARDSLPVAALESKVLEGVAKARPAAEIGRVVRGLAAEFLAARTAVRGALPGRTIADGEVVAVALATRQGVSPDVVSAVLASAPDAGSLEIPVTVLSELVRRGIPVDEASSLMVYVVRSEVPMNLTAQIPGKFDGALSAGAAPSVALDAALNTLNIQAGPGRGRGRGQN